MTNATWTTENGVLVDSDGVTMRLASAHDDPRLAVVDVRSDESSLELYAGQMADFLRAHGWVVREPAERARVEWTRRQVGRRIEFWSKCGRFIAREVPERGWMLRDQRTGVVLAEGVATASEVMGLADEQAT